jgi:hypothetical protein
VNRKNYLPMYTAAQATAAIPHTAAGQLAKMPFPTLKPKPKKDLEVGKRPKPSCAYAPTHEGNSHFENMDLKKITDFTALVTALHPQYKIAFSPHPFLQTKFGDQQQADLFLSLAQTFTLLNHSQRKTAVENVLATTDADYLQAYGLWQRCHPQKKQPVYMPTLQRVLHFLQYRYPDRPFTYLKTAARLGYSTGYIGKVFDQLMRQGHIEALPCNAKDGTRFFQLKQHGQ